MLSLNIFKPKLLLHICCGGCGAYVAQVLKKKYRVSLFLYNPNIFPEEEYNKRRQEVVKIANDTKLSLILSDYDHNKWLGEVKGHESDSERGGRCFICYQARMTKAAKVAKMKNFEYFTTTLSISPYKDYLTISKIGHELEKEYGVKFVDQDFKKQDGFKKSVCLSRELGLYRQNYCGCEFSRKTRK